MYRTYKGLRFSIAALLLTAAWAGEPAGKQEVVEITGRGQAVLWREPKDIAARNLYYGPGGEAHAPRDGFYTFAKEDSKGSNPKFDVIGPDGVKWKVKLGPEARPETVATRLVWAVGYTADEDYFVPVLRLKDAPERLHRGSKLMMPDGTVYAARLERPLPGSKKLGSWEWRHNPFTGSRELNGLRVLMAVMNNWDLKDVNNAVFQTDGPEGPQRIYEVSDLGATFGTTGLAKPSASRGNLKAYVRSKWIKHITPEYVDFNVPSRPAFYVYPHIPRLLARLKLRSLGRGIPREDARWMGSLLAQLSGSQIRDAFRAAGYEAADVETFSRAVEERIAELKSL